MSGNSNESGRTTSSRLLALLATFAPGRTQLNLTELAELSGLPKPTALRLVRELVDWGALERSRDGYYQVGLRMWKLGSLAPRQRSLRETALPFMQDLYEATKENVQLAVIEDGAALVLERIHGQSSVETLTAIGGRLPLHASAVGKVLLAYSGQEVFDELIAGGLPAFTPRTITDPATLATNLARIRDRGIAYVFEEMSLGAVSVGVPVFDREGTFRGALSVVLHSSTIAYRITPALRTAALGLGRELAAAS